MPRNISTILNSQQRTPRGPILTIWLSVAGIAGLYWSQDPNMTPEEVKALVIESADPTGIDVSPPDRDEREQRIGSGLAKFDLKLVRKRRRKKIKIPPT